MILLNLHDPQYYEQNQLKNLEFLGGNIKVEQKLYGEQDNDQNVIKYLTRNIVKWIRNLLTDIDVFYALKDL